MTWRYRIVKRKVKDPTKKRGWRYLYGIHEVFYNKDGKPCAMSEDAEAVIGETVEEVKKILKDMLEDCKKPVFTEPKKWAKWDYEE